MRTHFVAFGLVLIAFLVFMPLASASVYAASDIVVPRDFPTIQAAVNAAALGDTITVRSGTYTEEVVIGKDLTLRGAGVGTTVIKSPATLTPYAVNVRNGRPWAAIVRVGHGAHVRISGLTISGRVPCGTVSGVTAVQAATLELTDAGVREIQPQTSTCTEPRDVSVQFGAPPWIEIDGEGGSTADGRVTEVAIDSVLSEGIEATGPPGGPPSRVKLADDVITAGSPQYPTEQFGIVVFFAAVAQITGNTISGGVCTFPGCGPDPINEFQAMGIFVGPGGVSSRFSDNHASVH